MFKFQKERRVYKGQVVAEGKWKVLRIREFVCVYVGMDKEGIV